MFELKIARNGGVYFNLKAGNGEVILTGETYTSIDAALAGINSVRENAQSDAQFERKTASNGQPYFALKATNGQGIGRSEMYSSVNAMERGIAAVKRNAGAAVVGRPLPATQAEVHA